MLRCACALLLCSPALFAQGLLLDRRPDPAHTPGSVIGMGEHRLEVVLDGPLAEVTIEQTFLNRTGAVQEGTYLFPLPPDATVSGFAMTMGGRMVKGEILDATKARDIYHSIVRRRRDPGLLECIGNGLFRARVFPIPARGEIKVRIRYQQLLEEDSGTTRFHYPLATERVHRAPVGSVVVDARIKGAAGIDSVYCPSHKVDVARDPSTDEMRVTYERNASRQRRDLDLYVHRSGDPIGCAVLSHKPAGEDGTFVAILSPKSAAGEVPKDVVYLLDRSGSMEGGKLLQARNAVKHGISLLREGDRFNVLSFASDWTRFRHELVEATFEAKAEAKAWVNGQDAAGGTALCAALIEGMKMGTADRLFLVVLITDGKPTVGIRGRVPILSEIGRQVRTQPRVFTFGVGYDLDVELLDSIAEATRGARDYVEPGQRIDAVTGAFFRKIDQPALVSPRLEFGPGISHVYPRVLRDLFVGDQVIVMGRYTNPGDSTLVLRGRRGDEEVLFEHTAGLAAGPSAQQLPRLWAQRKVAFLLDNIRLHGARTELVDEVRRLATRYGIVTPYTAGLVVEDTPPPSDPGSPGGPTTPSGGVPPGMREPRDPLPPPRSPTSSSSPLFFRSSGKKSRVRDSKDLKEKMESATAGDDDGVRDAAGKTFRRDEQGRWVDTAYDGEAERTRIEAFSDEYFDLLERDERIAKYLAIGDAVIFVFEGTAYEITK